MEENQETPIETIVLNKAHWEEYTKIAAQMAENFSKDEENKKFLKKRNEFLEDISAKNEDKIVQLEDYNTELKKQIVLLEEKDNRKITDITPFIKEFAEYGKVESLVIKIEEEEENERV